MLSYFGMVKRFLTFALSVGFFIWLPSAFADGSGILSLDADAPATFRQVQTTEGSPLLTLRVNNIQVRADWEVTDADKVFTISAGVSPNEGVLWATGNATDTHVATIYVEDKFELLNPAYANLTASAVITVVFDSGVRLPAPRLIAVVGDKGSLYTFAAEGGSEDNTYTYTYALVGGNDDDYFGLDKDSGALSLRAGSQEGVYTLTVQVTYGGGVSVVAVATVELSAALMMADARLIYVALGSTVSLHTFIASGGIGVKNYGVAVGEESYFSVDGGSGVLSLKAGAQVGVHKLRVRATDEGRREVYAWATVRVSAMLSLADASSIGGAEGEASYLHTFAAQGGIGARTYILMAGEAAGYFSLGATSGTLSLLATAPAGMYTLSVQVKDEHGNMAQALATVDVRALYLASPMDTLYAIEGRAVSLHTFAAQGGGGEKTYILVAGNEDYFTLGAKNGVLSVLAIAPREVYTLSVQVENAVPKQATAVAIVEVRAPLSLTAVPPLTVILGRVAHTLVASGGIGTLTYAIKSGKDGFALDAASGVLSLSVNAELGRHTLTFRVTDERNNDDETVATVAVSAVLTLAAVPSFTVIASLGMNLHTFVAGGGIGAPTYAIVSGNDKKGFTLDAASGVLSLSVNAEPDNYVLSIEVTDARGNTDGAVATVGVSAVLSLADAPRLTAVAGEAVTLHMFSANGGIGIKTYTLAAGNQNYFSVDADSGVLSLRAIAQEGIYTLKVEVADDDRGSDAVEALAMVEVSAALMLADAPLIYVALESTVSLHTFIASGGIGIKTYTLAAGNENYFLVDAGSGTLSLLEDAQAGVYTLTVQAMDADSRTVVAAATVRVSAALMLADEPSFTVLAGVAIDLHTFAASGGIGVKTYTLVTGAEYFAVDADSGVLSVNASVTVGMYNLAVRVEDADGNVAVAAAMVEVTLLFLLEVPPLYAVAEVAQSVSVHTFAAVQGAVILTFTIFSGNDGEHFTLDPQSGVLFVQNASVAIYTLGVAGKDADNQRVEVMAVVDVDYALTLTAVSLVVQTGITAGFYQLSASGGGGVQTFTLAAAGNEAGYFALNATGLLQVSNAAVGAYTLLAGVSDDSGGSSQAKITVQVVQMSLADAPFLPAVAGLPLTLFLHTFAAYEGIGKLRYTIIAGNGSGYFALDADSGVLSLPDNPAVVAGTYSLRVGVSDSLTPPQQATAVATVHIGKNGIFVMGGDDGTNHFRNVWASADGKNWLNLAATDFPERSYHQAAVYQDKMYVLGGSTSAYLGDAWSAVGGRNWTVEANPAWGARYRHQAVVYQERLYVLGGGNGSTRYNDVWSRAAGESWSVVTLAAAWDARQAHQAVVHNGRMYVLGGGDLVNSPNFVKNDVWSSVDGKNWSFEGNADWPARAQHQAVSHNGRIYVLGGADLSGRYNDVWSWAGGERWRMEQANNNDFWSERSLFQAVSKDGLLYVMGGQDSGKKDDVWSSADGQSWTKVADANWSARSGFQAVVYPPNLTLPGTSETTILTLHAGLDIYPFRAQGGRAPYAYSLPPGTEGFNIDSGTGVLSANNAQVPAGTYQVTVRVEDDEGSRAESIINIELRVFVLADAPPLLAIGRLAVAVSLHAFTAAYGDGAYTFNLMNHAGDFILGEASGVFSVQANADVGGYTVSVEVSDARSNRATAVATVRLAKNGIFVLGGSLDGEYLNDVWMSADGKNWLNLAATGLPGRVYHQAAVYQDKMYVLGGSNGDLLGDAWSAGGGRNWTVEANPAWTARDRHQALAHQGRLYVIGGNDEDGIKNDVWSWAEGESSWMAVTVSAAWSERQNHQAVSHNGRIYVLGGYDSNNNNNKNDVWSSVDGKNWLFHGNADWSARAQHQAVSHNGRLYVMGGYDSNNKNDVWSWAGGGESWRLEKADNETSFWSQRDLFQAMSKDGLLYVLGGSGKNDVWSSADGQKWTKVADASWEGREGLAAVIFPPNLALSGSSETIVLTLHAGLDIYPFSAQGGRAPYAYSLPPETEGFNIDSGTGVLSANNAQVPVGTYQVTVRVEDDDGSHAESIINIELRTFALADAPPLLALGRLSVAARLHAFTAAYGDGAYTFNLVNNAGYFILGEASGVLSVRANADLGVYTVAVAVRDESSNRATAVATVRIIKNGIFVLGGKTSGFQNDVWLSWDSGWWQEANAAWPARDAHQAVVYKGRLWVMGGWTGGYKNDVWSSADGKSWSLLETTGTWSGRTRHRSVAYKGRLYVTGGWNGSGLTKEVWSWAPGEASWTMTTPPWSQRESHQVVVHNERLYLLGGQASEGGVDVRKNDVWSSTDGANWTFEGNAEWPIRSLHQAVSHQGRLYVMGGWRAKDSSTRYNDVWSSVDGRSWREEKANNSDYWLRRTEFQAVSRDGLLYVMGGTTANNETGSAGNGSNDVWTSADGKIWSLAGNAGWSVREGLQAVVFPPNLVLSGSSETISLTLQAGLDLEIYTFSAQGGFGQYTYSLPPETEGFKIDGDTGVLSTDKDQVSGGSHQVTVRVEDEDGSRAESIINIELPSFVLADAPPLLAIGRFAVAVSLHVFTDSQHGVGAYTFDLVNHADNFILGEASGVLSVQANAAVGVYTVSVEARDESSNRATAVATVRLAKNGIFMLGGSGTVFFNDVWAAVDGKNWVKVADADWSGRVYHQAVGYKGRLYVLGGSSGTNAYKDIWSSADGKNWQRAADPGWANRRRFQAVSHKGRLYVMGGGYPLGAGINSNSNLLNDVWSWAEGESSWTEETAAAAWTVRQDYQAVSHKGRLYVLGGGNTATDGGFYRNDVWSSVDGANWSFDGNADWPARTQHQAVSHNGRIYVLGGTSNATSTGRRNDVWSWAEGESWRMEKANNNDFWTKRGQFKALSYDGLLYVMGGIDSGLLAHNEVWSSADGVSWTKVTNADWAIRSGLQALVYPPNLTLPGTSQTIALSLKAGLDLEAYTFIAQGGFGQYAYSLPTESEEFNIDGGTGVLSANNDNVPPGVYQVTVRVEDEDGSRAESIINIEVRSFALADAPPLSAIGRFAVAVSLHTFTGRHGVGTYNYNLVNNAENFNLGATSGVLEAQANADVGVYTVSVAASDGRSNQATAVATVRITPNGIFVMGGSGGAFVYKGVWTSADGNRWAKVADAGWPVRSWHQAVEYQGRLYVMGGYDTTQILGDWWSSADGKTWARKTNPAWGARSQPQAVAHNGRLYVLGGTEGGANGRKNDVWSWAEGESWSAVTLTAAWSARSGHQALSHKGRLYVMGGYDGGYTNDMWSSVDGANWSFEGNAQWPIRTLHQAVSHNGRIYVLGGTDSNNNVSGRKNDVWSWAEGESSWTEEKVNISTSFWSPRASFQALSHDGLLYVMGGVSSNAVNDVWSSADGVSWTKVADADWSIRQGLQAVVFPPSLALPGTSETIALTLRTGRGLEIYTFRAQGGFGQYTYSLPPDTEGFKINSGTGVLSAANDQGSAGTYQVVVWVEDEDGSRAESIINVELRSFVLADAPPLLGLGRLAAAARVHTFTGQHGIGASTYKLVDDEGYFTLGEASGVLEAQANVAVGVYTVAVEARDGRSNRATAVATVRLAKNGIFMMGGGSFDDVWASADGKNWAKVADADWTGRTYHQAVEYQGRLYVMGGYGGSNIKDMWSSADGITWSLEATPGWTGRQLHQAVAHQGRLYVLGGDDGSSRQNDVWSWAKGESWSLNKENDDNGWEARSGHQVVSHNGRLYVLGGDDGSTRYNDVWSSVDGATWSFEGEAAWPIRTLHQAVSHQGRLYVLGGLDSGNNLPNDVWSWAEGESGWTPVKASNGNFWSGRYSYKALSRDGLLYVLGGNEGSFRFQNDVWSSADGVSWTKVANADWDARQGLQAVVFPPSLALPGTSETIALSLRAGQGLEIYTFRAQGGFGQYTYSLPPETEGFNINGGTGVLSANNDQVPAGVYQVVVQVEDEDGSRAQSIINIELLYFYLADAPPLFALGRLSVAARLHTFTAVYGDGALTYNLVGDESGYFTLGAASGVLSVTANVALGVYTVSVEVIDAGNNRATAVATVRIIKNGIFVMGGDDGSLKNDVWMGGEDGVIWRAITTNNVWPARSAYQVVLLNGRMYVLGGYNGGIGTDDVWSSGDGVTWTFEGRADWSPRTLFQAVSHQGTIYVMGGAPGNRGYTGEIWSSTDGITWQQKTNHPVPGRNYFQAVTHNGRIYVMGGLSDPYRRRDVWSSADGENWVYEGDGGWSARSRHQAVSHNGRIYVMGGNDGSQKKDVWSSVDGKNWRLETAAAAWPSRSSFQAVSRNGLLYVMGGDGNGTDDVWSSADGKIWTEVTADAGWTARKLFQAVVFPPNLALPGSSETIALSLRAGQGLEIYTFSAQGGFGQYAYSLPPGTEGFNINSGTGVLSANNDQVPSGAHQLTVRVDDEDGSRAESIINIELRYYDLADALPLFAIADLAESVRLHAFTAVYGVGESTYELVGDDSGYFTLGAASGVLSMTANVALGVYTVSVAASDADGNQATAVATVHIVKNRIFVLGGSDGGIKNDVWSSVDGEIWRRDTGSAGWTRRQLHQAVAHNGRLYVLGGADGSKRNDVWWSVDGANWQREADADWPGREIHQAVSYKGRLYVLGGQVSDGKTNDVWSSADGINWRQDKANNAIGWTARDRHQVVVHSGRIWLLGGQDSDGSLNDVWSSADGSSWRFERNADWDARYFHQVVLHGGRLYVMGGSDRSGNEGGVKNDVWSSGNGLSWKLEKEDNDDFWSKRYRHQSLSRDGLLYVLGGQDGGSSNGGRKKDVWSSADGKTWVPETDAAWTARLFHQAVVFPPE